MIAEPYWVYNVLYFIDDWRRASKVANFLLGSPLGYFETLNVNTVQRGPVYPLFVT